MHVKTTSRRHVACGSIAPGSASSTTHQWEVQEQQQELLLGIARTHKHGQKTSQLSEGSRVSRLVTSSERRTVTRGITTRKEPKEPRRGEDEHDKASRRGEYEERMRHEDSRRARGETTNTGKARDRTNSNTKYQGNARKITKRGIATGVGYWRCHGGDCHQLQRATIQRTP